MGWSALLPVLGALAGGLGGRAKKQTGQFSNEQQGTQSSSTQGSSISRRLLLPQQQALLDPLAARALELIRNPQADLGPIYGLAASRINEQYSGVPSALAQRFLAHGGTASGKFGRSAREAELARMSQLGALQSDLARAILEQQERGTSLAQNLLGMVFGQQTLTDSSSVGSYRSTQSGTSMNVLPGNVGYGLFSGGLVGLGDMLALRVLQDMLKGNNL